MRPALHCVLVVYAALLDKRVYPDVRAKMLDVRSKVNLCPRRRRGERGDEATPGLGGEV